MSATETRALAHIFLDGQLRSTPCLNHVPRTGDTVRLRDDVFAKVTEVIWCLDEASSSPFQRVNIRLESEKVKKARKG